MNEFVVILLIIIVGVSCGNPSRAKHVGDYITDGVSC